MQYDAHNMKGYLDYKKLLGFMETDLFADAAPRSGSAGQEFDAQTRHFNFIAVLWVDF